MKILAIRGKNLASLAGEFAIEFDRPPLDRAGLFAITGATGAGKSTILDAICLALFDRVPRLPAGQGVVVGRADEEEALRVRSNDVRSILRRGTAECFAEVDFRAGDGRLYRARWDLRRARRSVRGRLQPQEMRLIDVGENRILATRKTEVLTEISSRLGLSFDQFRRSVLLAQGDFAAFLKASSNQRSDLLENITGTDIYSRLSVAAYQRALEERARLSELELRLEELTLMDEPSRLALVEEERDLKARLEELDACRRAAERVIEWYVVRDRLRSEGRESQEGLRASAAAIRETLEVRSLLDSVERALPLRADLDRLMDARRRQSALRELQSSFRNARDSALARADQLRRKSEGSELQSANALMELQAARPVISQARRVEDRIEDVQTRTATLNGKVREEEAKVAATRREVTDLEESLEKLGVETTRLEDWVEQNRNGESLSSQWGVLRLELGRAASALIENGRAERQLRDIESRRKDQERSRNRLAGRLERIRKDVETRSLQLLELEEGLGDAPAELSRAKAEIDEQRREFDQLGEIAREAKDLRAELQAHSDERRELRRRLRSTRSKLGRRTRALEAARRSLDEMEASLLPALKAGSAAAREFRSDLKAGEFCPVCGSTEHPWEHSAPDTSALTETKLRVEKAREKVGLLTRDTALLDAGLQSARDRIEDLDESRRRLLERRKELLRRWRENLGGSASDGDSALVELLDSLAELEVNLKARETEHRMQERTVQEKLKRVSDLRARLREKRETRDRLNLDCQEMRAALSGLDIEQAAPEVQLSQARESVGEAKQVFGKLLAGTELTWDGFCQAPGDFLAICSRRVERWRNRLSELESSRDQMSDCRARLQSASRELMEAKGRLDLVRRDWESLRASHLRLTQERRKLLGAETADDLERRLTGVWEAAKSAATATQQTCEESGREFAVLEEKARMGAQQVSEAMEDHERARKAFQEGLVRCGLSEEELTPLLTHDRKWAEQRRRELTALERAHEKSWVLFRERRRQRRRHESSGIPDRSREDVRAEIELLDKQVRETQESLAEIVAALSQDRRRREKAGALTGQVSAQRKERELWESMRELIGSADGARFRTFAQSLTFDMLVRHANRHLGELTRRYRLERVPDTDLEVQVIDLEMGDEVRSVHTLSGGESFQVSLSLALGLASLSAPRTQVESLFIDEGFGSLDARTLDLAISSLDALQALGRKIGVISHVSTLVERIGVQVRVTSLGGGRSAVEIRDCLEPDTLMLGRFTQASAGLSA